MEEPENGIHPANLPAMVDLIRDLAVDPSGTPDAGNPFRQVIVNTHSPGVVQLCDPDDLLLAEVKQFRSASGDHARALSLLPFAESWRAESAGTVFTRADVVSYLTSPEDARITLPSEIAG